MSTTGKSYSRPPGRAEGEADSDDKEPAPVKKTRLVKVSLVFEGPSTAKRFCGDSQKIRKELIANAKEEGRALKALELGYAPVWTAPDGACRPRAKNEDCCLTDLVLTTGPVPLRDLFVDDGKSFSVITASLKDVAASALRKLGCNGTFLTGSLQSVTLLQHSVIIPSNIASGVTVAPVIHKSNGDLVTKLKRPTLVVVTGGGSRLGRTAGSASHYHQQPGSRAEIKHEVPVTTDEIGTSVGEGSIQGELCSGTASGFSDGRLLYERESGKTSDSDGCCTFHKVALEGVLSRLRADTDKTITIPLSEETPGVAPSLQALLFCEFAHIIFNAPPGSRPLRKALQEHLVYKESGGKKHITGVIVKRSTMIKVVERALKKHTDDQEVFSPEDRVGFSVTPVLQGMSKDAIWAWSRRQEETLAQKPAVYNPLVSITLTAEIGINVRRASEGKESDEEEITEPDSESEQETTAAADDEAEEEEEEEEQDEELNFGDE